MKKKCINFLLLMAMLICSALPSYAAENYLESYFDTSNMTPERNYVKFRICFYNDCGKDSWISGPLHIYVDNEIVCTTYDYSGEDVDDRNCSKVSHSYGNQYCNNANQNVRVEFKDRYDNGSDSWVWVYVYFSRLFEGKTHNVGFGAYYCPNHGGPGWQSISYTYAVDLSCMSSKNNTMGSSGPYTATLSNITTKYNKDHQIVLFKSFKSENYASTWANWSSSEYYAKKTVQGGSKAFTMDYKIPSNYYPVTVYPKYYMYSSDDVIYMDYLTSKTSPYFPKSINMSHEYDQWTREVKLTWQKNMYNSDAVDDGCWMISRQEEGNNDTWQFLGTSEKNTLKYVDKTIDEQGYDKTYKYMVSYVPKSWGTPSSINFKDLYAEDLSCSKTVKYSREFMFSNINVTSPGDCFNIQWTGSYIPVNGLSYKVLRKKEGTDKFEEIKTVSVNKNKNGYECTDNYEIDASSSYTYQISIDALGKTFYSDEVTQILANHSQVTSFTASKGVYNNSVHLSWNAQQVGESDTYFVIYRKSVDKSGVESLQDYKEIYSTSGKEKSYNFIDQAINNGVFYSYKIESYSLKSDGVTKFAPENIDDIGFSSQTGTISGSVNFAGGTAVDSVKVGLEMIDDSGNPKPTYSLFSVGSLDEGLKWDLSESTAKLFSNKDWTIQLFVNPSSDNSDNSELMQVGNLVVGLKKYANGFAVSINGIEANGVIIPADVFSSLTLSYSKAGKITATLIDSKDSIQTATLNGVEKPNFSGSYNSIIIGGSQTANENLCYHGYVDDVRVFSGRNLSLAEINTTYNRILSGSEKGLVAYWPMDEGLDGQHMAFDYSMQNGSANENHANIMSKSSLTSGNVPSSNQLCLYAMTDKDGNYIIRGVPYYDEGSNYIVRPTKGIHNFSPATVTRYFSSSSSVYGGSDFKDESSFPVSGKVYYVGTEYPVEGCELYVDGIAANKDGEIVRTDKEGYFSFDIPIGNHFISVKKSGHEFSYGRYPADGTVLFDHTVGGLVFKDSTTVVIAGRVTGGQDEYIKPLGFNTSINNIGTATIVLDAGLSMNTSASDRSYSKAVGEINSGAVSASRGSGSSNLITIKTDAESGEFAVKLPPILYQVKSVKIEDNPLIEFNNLSSINATNALIEYTDSISEDSVTWKYFKYNNKLKLAYRSKPILNVTPVLPSKTFFGEPSEEIVKENGDTINVEFYNESAREYTYGYPVFMQYNFYNWKLEAYEPYENNSKGKQYKVPLRGVQVSASNYMSVGNYVKQNGEMQKVEEGKIDLDSLGTAIYRFQVGFPNIAEPYTLPVKFSYNIDGNNYSDWYANGDDGKDFKGIVFGDLPSGNNFVTAGPTIVDMVLRDPPGSASYTSWTKGTSVTNSYKFDYTHTTNSNIKVSANFGVESSTAAGFGVMIITPMKVEAGTEDNITNSTTWSNGKGWTTVTTATSTISTSSDPMYDGPDADVFIGKSSNEIIGKARDVNLHEVGGQLIPSVKELFTRGLKFGTQFNYTQNEIINHVIPQYKDLINSMLIAKGTQVKNNETYYKYLSLVDSDDSSYGTLGSYELIEPENVTEEIILKDSIAWCWEQIINWQNRLADNEKAKIACINNRESLIDDNFSFDAGSHVENAFSRSNSNMTSSSIGSGSGISISISTGFKIMGAGTGLNTTTGYNCNSVSSNSSETETSTSFKYALVETGANDAISVDVYNTADTTKHIDNFGPIFVTRAGRTSGNYEPQHTSRFYSPGTVIMSGTSKVNVPKLICENAPVSGVRTGTPAILKFNLNNISETKSKGYYYFAYDTGENPNGAIIRCGDADMANNVEYLIDYNSPITATVTLTQSNPDILDYRIPFYLMDKTQCKTNSIYPANADTVIVEVHFAQASSEIELATKNPILNKAVGDSATFVIFGYDMNMKNFKSFSLQYRGENDTEWRNADGCTWRMNENVTLDAPICKTPSVTCGLKMSNSTFFPDQTYLFRACSVSNFGGEDVNAYSDEIEVIKDMVAPAVFGKPYPLNGVYGLDSEVGIAFNEDIVKPTKSNVTLKGVLNNSTVNHEVALYCDGTRAAITESRIGTITNYSSFNLWLKRMNGKITDKEGTIVGDMTNGYAFNVDAEGHLIFRKGQDEVMISENVIPENVWTFLAISYSADENGEIVISADCADEGSGEVVSLFNKKVVPFEISKDIGRIYIGDNFVGSIQELTLWDAVRSFDVANSEKSLVKTQYTNGLKAYWPLNDGRGKIAKEIVHDISLALTSESNWRVNRTSYALKLSAKQSGSINLSNIATSSDDDYLIQFWFMANAPQSEPSTLFSINNNMTQLLLDGDCLNLVIDDCPDAGTSSTNYSLFDKKWHRIGLYVRKSNNGNASLAFDGKVVGVFPAEQASNLMGKLIIGGNFDGYIDEFRIWRNPDMNEIGDDMMYESLNVDVEDVDLYLPFEVQTVGEGNQKKYSFYLKDVTGHCGSLVKIGNSSLTGDSQNVPPVTSAPQLKNVNFNLVSTEREIKLKITDPIEKIQGCNLTAKVTGLSDKVGNKMGSYSWKFNVDMASLYWENDTIASKFYDYDCDYKLIVVNRSSVSQSWNISNIPSWMQLESTSGTLQAGAKKEIDLNIVEGWGLGFTTGSLYLNESNGISHPLTYKFNLCSNKPWPDSDLVKGKKLMTIIGQVELNGEIVRDNEFSTIAAYSDSTLVGIGELKYIDRLDGCYVTMTVYGDTLCDKPLRFGYFDAKNDEVHPYVKCCMQDTFDISFVPNEIIGSYSSPVRFIPSNLIRQQIYVDNGWNLISFNAQPEMNSISKALYIRYEYIDPKEDNTLVVIHDDEVAFNNNNGWSGDDIKINTGGAYLVNSSCYADLYNIGVPSYEGIQDIQLRPGWTWLGANLQSNTTLKKALSDMNPLENDMIRDRDYSASYVRGGWIGTLDALKPGKGYMYYSNADVPTYFHYPTKATLVGKSLRTAVRRKSTKDDLFYGNLNSAKYAGTMVIVASVEMNGQRLEDVELAAFDDNGEIRGEKVASTKDGLVYMVIHGDEDCNINVKAVTLDDEDSKVIDVPASFKFRNCDIVGSPSNPYIINLDATDIINANALDNGKSDIYDLSGRKILNKNVQRGIYIKDGRKVMVK